jgi:hypothetical protein
LIDELDDRLLARLLLPPGHDETRDGLARLALARRPCCWPTPSPPTGACASWPTTTATAPPPVRWPARPAPAGRQHVDYLVPDRVVDGYGLTPPIAQRVKDTRR